MFLSRNGVLAPRYICSLYLNVIFNKQNIHRLHKKSTCCLGYIKKINFGAKNKIFYGTCFVILHWPCAMSFFAKLYKRIWIMEMYMWNFLFEFFNASKYIFFSIESIYTCEPNWISVLVLAIWMVEHLLTLFASHVLYNSKSFE
jgi:hypothetical protein